ncbi:MULTISPECIES: hypothetical protein [unclassified Streptomyces]|uniref:hypothetical protein n=1 Tax=unclassified Streptomyces TaxID=2593676 RepID=UPI00336A5E41
MRRRFAMLLSAMAVAVPAVTLGGGTPAVANSETGSAAVERFWVYGDDGMKGDKKSYTGTDRNFENDEWDGGSAEGAVSDSVSSVDNNTSRYVVLYANRAPSGSTVCSGAQYTSRPWTSDGDLSNNNFDNKADCLVFQ